MKSMKKIAAAALSCLMAGAMLAGCGTAENTTSDSGSSDAGSDEWPAQREGDTIDKGFSNAHDANRESGGNRLF